MSFEIKTYLQHYGDEINNVIQVFNSFGWNVEEQQVIRSGRISNTKIIFTRDRSIPHYLEVVDLEKEYTSLTEQEEDMPEIDGYNLLLCFMLLILPGIIYLTYKLVRRYQIKESNAELKAKEERILSESRNLIVQK